MEKHNIIWRNVEIEITFTPEKFGMVEHIELRTPYKDKLRVTDTGYRSHFIAQGTASAHGGAAAFVTAWLDHEATRNGWNNDQLALF